MNRVFQFVGITKCALLAFHFQQGSASVELLATPRFNGAQFVCRRSSRCRHSAVRDHGIMTFSFQTVALSKETCMSIDDGEMDIILLFLEVIMAPMKIQYRILE
jgi:hypothetical protein